jgi:hypothetical protein
MGLFDRSAAKAGKLRSRTALLLPHDPGHAFMDTVRLYDPKVRSWPDRLIFHNGVLLFGPIPITPKLGRDAGLTPGMTVAYYTGIALESHRERRPDEAKQWDGDKLVQSLAARLGGTAKYSGKPPNLALKPSVYSEQDVPAEQVIELLSPYSGDLSFEDEDSNKPEEPGGGYMLSGEEIYFQVAYWPPSSYRQQNLPPALGDLRSRPQRRWDLHAAFNRKDIDSDVIVMVGEAALALARRCDGVALDEHDFPFTSPQDLLPR